MPGRPAAAAEGSLAPDPGWHTRQAGRLLLHYRAHSFAALDIDELAARYAEASTAVLGALELEPSEMSPIGIYLADLPSEPEITEVASSPSSPAELTLWSVYTSETPGPVPEAELTRLLLDYSLGPAPAGTAFWDEGLAGYLAASSGHPVPQAEAEARCRQLLADGLLPPVAELLAESGHHRTALAASVATSFASYLIERHGLARYRRLVREARATDAAFEQTYHLSLAVAARDWRRHLEAVGRGGQTSAWTPLRQLLPLARPYWGPGLSILLLTLVGIGFSLALPLAFRFLIDNVLGHRPLQDAIPFVGPRGYVITSSGEQLQHLLHLLIILSLLYLLGAAARLRLNNLINTVSESFVLDLRQKMLEVLVRLPLAYYARTPLADISHRVVQDSVSIQQLLTGTLVPIVAGALSVVLYAAMLLALQAQLALLALLGLPLLGLIYRLRRRSLRAASGERVQRVADLSAHVHELLGAQLLVKVYTAAPYLLGILGRRLEVHRVLNTAYALESSLLVQVGALVMHLTQVIVLLAGSYLVVVSEGRDLAPGTLVAFYVLLNQLFGPVAQVASASQNLAGASASVERVAELVEQPAEPDPPRGVVPRRLRDELRFEDVSFAYARGRPVLQQLNLSIRAGATVGFVGPTGAGKSSVVQLIARLYDPTRGRITWDGLDLREARLEALRAQLALVPQDAFLLSGSVYDNIRFGLDAVSDEQVRRAAHLARADEFIAGLADGYDTIVGDHGVGLSGGQRQRVALARALLRDPSVLILDEATSALDATTQREVQESLGRGGERRTLIKIAHHLETVADADVIFVLDGGRLVEQGRHAELQATGGLYARLLEDQVGLLNAAGRPTAREAVRWLGRLAPFASLPSTALEALVGALTTVERRAGEIVYRQGSPGEELYVVARGRAEALEVDEAGRERVTTTLGVGTPLGVAAFVRGLPRTASIRAATDLLLFVLQRPAWQAILAQVVDGQANRPAET